MIMIRVYWGGRAFDSFRVKITPITEGFLNSALANSVPEGLLRRGTRSSGKLENHNCSDCIFGVITFLEPGGLCTRRNCEATTVRDEASRTQNYSYIEIPTCRTCYIKMLKFYQKRGTRFLLPRGPNRHCHRFCWASHSELCVCFG